MSFLLRKCRSLIASNLSRHLSVGEPLSGRRLKWPGRGPNEPWLSVYQHEDGQRGEFQPTVERFKRLDWGWFIRAQGGRNKKQWRKGARRLWDIEAHVIGAPFHQSRGDRAFSMKTKAARFIPDDPYEKYNKMSFHKYHALREKNARRIRDFGDPNHKFAPWKAHLSKHRTKYNSPEQLHYTPPGFLGATHDHGGVYEPEFRPRDTPVPFVVRPQNRFTQKTLKENEWKWLKIAEVYAGKLDCWHPLYNNEYKKF